ncbi:hypothetical protein CMI47_02195 [Candidatus Pacearchaeota archaeon]|nr:hypothetical protein [Candidatus Pacearchaeota archaeon]|tara:strand:+ start:3041 stop:3418 length:378 start_codon:yes stop_codon:yes gene_type:complete
MVMKFNPNLKQDLEKFKSYSIIVEGKKDVAVLKNYGFEKVYAIHATGVPIRERVEQIALEIDKKDKVCILTDLDKKGKKLYLLVKPMFQELGFHLDSSLRGILIKSQISHIEGLSNFLDKVENIG